MNLRLRRPMETGDMHLVVIGALVLITFITIIVIFINDDSDEECRKLGGHLVSRNVTTVTNGKVGVGAVSMCLSEDGRILA